MTNDNKITDFPDRLRYLIKESSDENKAFAKKCGIGENQLYVYLRGKSEPGMRFFKALKEQYPWTSIDWLVSGKGEPIIELEADKDSVIAMDPAVKLILDVEKELNVKLNDKQRNAVVAVLRKEFERRLDEQKAEIANLISSFS